MKAFNFEIYTLNPITKETGWEIEFPTVYANSYQHAIEILKNDYPDFDCVILFNWVTELDGSQLKDVLNGIKFKDDTALRTY